MKSQLKIIRSIESLKTSGNIIKEPLTKNIYNSINELRIKQGNNCYRILFFFYHNKKIILTNGFIKKTNKTPLKEINLAIKYRKDWIERYEQWSQI